MTLVRSDLRQRLQNKFSLVHLHMRDFVLRPLREIAPHKRHPVFQKTITQLAEALEDRTQ